MNGFDRYIKYKAANEPTTLTSLVKERVERTLDNLPESIHFVRNRRHVKKLATAAACIAFAVLIVLPNVSRTYAEATEHIPLLGKIVRVVTIRNYFYDDGKHELDIDVPQLEKDGSEAVDYINKDVGELTSALVKQFYSDLDMSGNNGYGSIRVDYEVLTNTERFFTLKLSVSETAASSNQYYRFYHIDKSSWQRTELGDLFKSDSYREVISEEIKRQMYEQIAADPNISYRINGSGDGEEFTAIDAKRGFYFNESGDIVIVFDKYEVAPGSVGSPEFVIDIKLLEPLLKDEYVAAR